MHRTVNPYLLASGPAYAGINAYNTYNIARTTPTAMSAGGPSGQTMSAFMDAMDARLGKIAPGKQLPEIAYVEKTPTQGFAKSMVSDLAPYASNARATTPGNYNIFLNPNADRAYLAHEMGHVTSDQTDIGNMIRSARDNPKLTKALLAAAAIGGGSVAAINPGDDDLATSVALAYAAAAPTLADEILATKNGLAIMKDAGMRATLGQRAKLAGALLSYAGAPLLIGASSNLTGNLVDEDVPPTYQ